MIYRWPNGSALQVQIWQGKLMVTLHTSDHSTLGSTPLTDYPETDMLKCLNQIMVNERALAAKEAS